MENVSLLLMITFAITAFVLTVVDRKIRLLGESADILYASDSLSEVEERQLAEIEGDKLTA